MTNKSTTDPDSKDQTPVSASNSTSDTTSDSAPNPNPTANDTPASLITLVVNLDLEGQAHSWLYDSLRRKVSINGLQVYSMSSGNGGNGDLLK